MEKASIFEQNIKQYLHQVAHLGSREETAATLGVSVMNEGFRIPFFHQTYTVTSNEIINGYENITAYAVSVILCKYLILCPDEPDNDVSLVTFKDFKDATPLVWNFRTTIEQAISTHFTHEREELEKRCLELGGEVFDTEVSCQLAMRFQALPKVPLYLLYNDADEDFPAQTTLLFQRNAASYLDMECLAMVGGSLVHLLKKTVHPDKEYLT